MEMEEGDPIDVVVIVDSPAEPPSAPFGNRIVVVVAVDGWVILVVVLWWLW